MAETSHIFSKEGSSDLQLEVLNTLEKNDVTGQFHCVSLLEWFEYRGHVCMAFERLGLSLYDFLRRSGYHPFQVNLVSTLHRVHVHFHRTPLRSACRPLLLPNQGHAPSIACLAHPQCIITICNAIADRFVPAWGAIRQLRVLVCHYGC